MSHPQGIQQYAYAYPAAPPHPHRPWPSPEDGPGQGDGYERDPYDTYRPSYEPGPPYGEPYGEPYGLWEAREPYGAWEVREPDHARGAREAYGFHEPYGGYGPPPPGGGSGDPRGVRTGVREDAPEPVPGPAAPSEPDTPEPTVLIPRQATGGRAAARRAARERKAARRPGDLRRLVPQAVVVAFLAGGTSAFVADDKAVELTVEGEPRTLHTFADDVSELLADEGVRLGEHDAVSPAPGEPLSHGDRVTVRHARPLVLTLDGRPRRVWTTARTVAEALRGIGVRPEGAYLSVPGGRAIGRGGLTLAVRTERAVTVLADGRERTVRTNAATVREALEEAGVELRGEDTVSVPLDSFPREGQTVSVLRVTDTEQVHDEPIPFPTERRADPTLTRGTEVVAQEGSPGLRRTTYRVRTVNGVRQEPRHTGTEVVRAPTPRIVRVGTKAPPSSVAGADHLDWDALARCESGGRPDAVDPSGTHGGLYQFDTPTWRSLGGKGRPQDAPPAEQTHRAKKLYVQKGASPWPVCGRKLHR
ncbi:ubiquitin-like domain-containing protein [Streptomyces desertarenae]|uniref:Ubiquitin-like domain-containing protein n=1 Tax=Streptomyces desertarenae TaxID=2666184 RepID=A0ABW4PFD4_9ACTN